MENILRNLIGIVENLTESVKFNSKKIEQLQKDLSNLAIKINKLKERVDDQERRIRSLELSRDYQDEIYHEGY